MQEDESIAFLAQLFGVVQAIERTSQSMLRRLGVSARQRLVVRMLANGDHSAGDLARGLRVDPSTMTGILTRLERDEFIERFMDPSDRRSWRFQLTQKGRGVVRLRNGTVEAAIVEMMGKVPPADVESTKRTLATLERTLGEVCKHLDRKSTTERVARRFRNGTNGQAGME